MLNLGKSLIQKIQPEYFEVMAMLFNMGYLIQYLKVLLFEVYTRQDDSRKVNLILLVHSSLQLSCN